MQFLKTFSGLGNILFDEVFPDQCLNCGSPNTHLCDACQEQLPQALHHPSPWINARFSYQNPIVQKLIVWMKKYPDQILGNTFAASMADMLVTELSDRAVFGTGEKITIVPIPIDGARFRERGYNQSALLARSLAEQLEKHIPGTTCEELLEKIIKTKKQAVVNDRGARLRNIRGAFRARPPARNAPLHSQDSIAQKTIILVDDVSTTGATLADAKRALRAAGYRTIIAAVIAH